MATKCGGCDQSVSASANQLTCGNLLTGTREACGALIPGVLLQSRWEIESCIARAGQARTYKAQDIRLKRKVVVKELLNLTENSPAPTVAEQQEYADNVRRFEREATILQNNTHPRIPEIYDLFKDTPLTRNYLVMKFVEGESLDKTLATFPGSIVPEDQAIKWVLQILEVLEFIHGQTPPLCHRDLKPSNVIRPPNDQLTVIDFGIAHPLNQQAMLTANLGTMGYAARELFKGMVEPRSDLFALGAMLHQFLTGSSPDKHPIDTTTGKTTFPSIASLRPQTRKELIQIVEKAVQFEEKDRYSSAAEFRRDLEALQPGNVGGSAGAGAGSGQSAGKTVGGNNAGAAQPPVAVSPAIQTWTLPPHFGSAVLVYVPPGSFWMGSSEQEVQNLLMRFGHELRAEDVWAECPRRRELMARGFWIFQHPVTCYQYQCYLAAHPHLPVPNSGLNASFSGANVYARVSRPDAAEWNAGRRTPPPGMEHHPVTNVSWREAADFARWIGGHLPTEREWERAARGEDGRNYPWGNDDAPYKCHNFRNGATGTAAINGYPQGVSPAGCWDMAGNVREWTCDEWNAYPNNAYYHSAYGRRFVATRGSSWQEDIARMRCAARSLTGAEVKNTVVGFRCVIDSQY